jgi:intracellular sulfur oxidation DsrE/DsrF family protein
MTVAFNGNQNTARRQFVAKVGAGLGLLTGLPLFARADEPSGDDGHEHDAWMKQIKAKHRQLFHAMDLNDRAMLLASNFLDAYHDAFGAKPGEAAAVIGVHGGALAIGFSDAAWAKYGFAKTPNLLDPSTKEVAARNIFAAGAPLTVDALQKRGVVFLMCNTALRLSSQALAKARGESFETVYEDLKASRLPGTILVPAMVVAINRSQEAGFSYLRV